MKFTVALLGLATLATAIPQRGGGGGKRSDVDIAFCRVENFQNCDLFFNLKKQDCNAVPDALNDRVRSISFTGADQCTFYNDAGCAGRNFTDSGSVPDVARTFKNKISSYRCT